MKKRLIIFLFAATLCMTGVSSVTAHAETKELVNSVGSDAKDESQGVDETQGQKTQYEKLKGIETTTYDENEAVSIYATKTSYVVATVPRKLILGQDENDPSTYTCNYLVKAQADIAGKQKVRFTPTISDDFIEVDGKESATNSSVLINGKSSITIGANDFLNGKEFVAEGTVTVQNVTAGIWKGGLDLNIEVLQDEN